MIPEGSIFVNSFFRFLQHFLGGIILRVKKSSDRPAVHCTLCGREIVWGEEYWCCNGTLVCRACLPELALRELLPCREVRGREVRL